MSSPVPMSGTVLPWPTIICVIGSWALVRLEVNLRDGQHGPPHSIAMEIKFNEKAWRSLVQVNV